MCVTLTATLCVWHVLSSAAEIDMDGENKLENKINIVYYVHWELEALSFSLAVCVCVCVWMYQKAVSATTYHRIPIVPKCSAIYVIGIWILEVAKSSTIYSSVNVCVKRSQNRIYGIYETTEAHIYSLIRSYT